MASKKNKAKESPKGAEKKVALSTVGLKIRQSSLDIEFYVFAIDGKTIAKQLGVKRMKWHGAKFKAEGFQRALDMTRVRQIANYLSENPPILPNALVVAFEKGTLNFTPLPNQSEDALILLGTLEIRGKLREIDGELEPMPESERIGYVIDGQHRIEGVMNSTLEENDLPVIISAFHNISTQFQLEQFYALNQTVPISQSLLALLRRELGLRLQGKEARKQAISRVCELLQQKPNSPFAPGIIKSPIYPGKLDVTTVERMLDRAISNTDLKFQWRADANDIPLNNLENVAQGLYVFWRAISEVFARYWNKKPSEQRLFSALGFYSLIEFYDRVMKDIDVNSNKAISQAKERLKPIADLPWDKMQRLPATPKNPYIDLLRDALSELWSVNGARPYTFTIKDPSIGENLVELELKGS